MSESKPTPQEHEFIRELVSVYESNQGKVRRLLESLDDFISNAETLRGLIHSVKKRMKDPKRLEEKLIKKLGHAKLEGEAFGITPSNLFTKISDLGGYRILHLHTRQMERINLALLEVLSSEAQCTVIEGPKANVWDKESEEYFEKIGIETEYNPRMYSSVHYVVQPNNKAEVTIEIQVRTLSEEIWGEVDHKFNYPNPVDSVACREQIRALARVASSCTRLVDSIFASYDDWLAMTGAVAPASASAPDQLEAIKNALRGRKLLWSILGDAIRWDLAPDKLRIVLPKSSEGLIYILRSPEGMQRLRLAVAEVLGYSIDVSIDVT